MKKYIAFFIAVFLMVTKLSAQANYVRTCTATAPETNPNTLITRPLSDAKQITQYYDGLGRPVQAVTKQGSLETSSGSNYDLVSMSAYDNMDRQNISYLPYVAATGDGTYKADALTAQPAFYNSGASPVAGQGETGANAHSQINYELSPLSKPIKTMAAGNNWVGSSRGIGSGYFTNLTPDDVRMWTVTNAALGSWGTYKMTGVYPNGSLYKTITTDENGHQVVEFKDKSGLMVLRKVGLSSTDNGSGSGYPGWLCTYYIYDILNNLRCVIQPAGVQTLTTNGWSLTATATLLTDQCFRYEYDQRNRMVVKKAPGAGEVYMVYDARDRLVMTQDENLWEGTSKWLVTVYDNLNRPVKTGLLTDANFLPTEISNAYNSITYPATSSGFEMLTQTHYDDYTNLPTNSPSGLTATFQTTWNSNFSSTNLSAPPYPVMPVQAATYLPRGLVTWTQSEVLGTNGATYLTSVNIYDEKGRVIQTQSQNYSQGIDVTTTQYNWSGQQLETVHKQQKAGTNAQTTVTVSRTYYDNLNRPVKTTKQIQNTLVNSNTLAAENNISQMQYDKLGELKIKNLGNTKSGSSYTANPLETLNYDYNIRGWLLGVNRAFVRDLSTASSGSNSGETFTTPPSYSAGNYFGFELGYDKAPTVGGSSWTGATQYNGNITGMIWKSVHDGQIRKYDYTYDNVNRLMIANFTQYTGSSFNQNAGINYTANNLSYDANGNILFMNQYGLATATATTSVAIDQLTYTLITGTNKLQSVSDVANGNTPAPGAAGYLGDYHYASGTSSGAVYSYDGNGNLTSDNNKKISSITYNYLNLPQTITVSGKGTITYTYDAMGNKLQKQTIEGSTTTTTLYGAGTIYINNALQFVLHEEGRIRVNSTNNGYIFDYFLKDHLGNTRMTITDDNTAAKPVIDATSYYPFGLIMQGISSKAANTLENKYKYNGKELQHNEFSDNSGLELYDFGARVQDPQLGRWCQIDPLSDQLNQQSWSSYHFGFDNPILRNDPTGMYSPIYDQEGDFLGTDNQGLQGKAIVMEKDKFQQSMTHKDAMKNNLGVAGLNDDAAGKKLLNNYNSLKDRPDYDGYMTYKEGIEWLKNGGGSVYLDASKYDLGSLSKDAFSQTNQPTLLNLLNYATSTSKDAWYIFGNNYMTLTSKEGNGTVKLGEDDFDYNYHTAQERKGKDAIENTMRDIGIWWERLSNGINGNPSFHIFPYGTAKLNPSLPIPKSSYPNRSTGFTF